MVSVKETPTESGKVDIFFFELGFTILS